METDGGSILVVDDNENNRDLLSRRLERAGHRVQAVEDGAQALAIVAQQDFDLVLLDVMMPGIDGFEVLRRLRAEYAATHLPVIMATAKGEREDIVQALNLGANDYVTKPLDLPVVLARVRTQLSLKRAVDTIIELERDLERRNDALQAANQRMKRDLTAAARIQHALLPSVPPPAPGVAFSWQYRPCTELGGDILNLFALDEDHVGMYVLDVSGHGVPAALLSVTLSRVLAPLEGQSSLVRRHVDGSARFEATSPSQVAGELNRRFQVSGESDQFFTLVYGVLDLRSRELNYVSAGHPAPVYVPRDGPAVDLASRSFPIGWVPGFEYPQRTLRLSCGDRLYLYSDGIPEARRGDKSMFGVGRIVSTAGDARGMELSDSVTRLIQAAREWSGSDFDDDVTALAIEIQG